MRSVLESMTNSKWISCGLAFGLVSASAIWSSCNKEPQPEGRTALEHAYECEAVLGPLPRFSCEDAVPVPVTKNGIALTLEQAGEGETNDPSLCDCPAAFGKACDPGFRVGRYTGLNQDGTPNEDVVFLTNCRDGGLGVIGYKFSTGETCFLHINNETTGAFDLDIPRPGEDDYNNSWQWPNVVAHDNCQNCHMASPFLHSPAVDQLKNPEDTTELLVPITGNGPYSIVGAEFGPLYESDIDNSCTSCHRPQCTEQWQNYPLDELQMPAPFTRCDRIRPQLNLQCRPPGHPRLVRHTGFQLIPSLFGFPETQSG